MINRVIIQYGAHSTYECVVWLKTLQRIKPAFTTDARDSGHPTNMYYYIPIGGQSTFTFGPQGGDQLKLYFTLDIGGNYSFRNVIFHLNKEGGLTAFEDEDMNYPSPERMPAVVVENRTDHFVIKVGAYTDAAEPGSWLPGWS